MKAMDEGLAAGIAEDKAKGKDVKQAELIA